MTIVVARYKEDISWLNFLKAANSNINTFVINKFHVDDPMSNMVLPNVGRESHSYLWYIINNYVCLDDFTCFVQGSPFFHCPNVIDIINNFDGSQQFYPFGTVFHTVKDACPHHSDLVVSKFDDLINSPAEWSFNGGAQFIVSRDRILRHSKDFYQQLFDRHFTYEHTPWCLERLWKFVYGDTE
jgi:Protein of unknown function (DUF3431)